MKETRQERVENVGDGDCSEGGEEDTDGDSGGEKREESQVERERLLLFWRTAKLAPTFEISSGERIRRGGSIRKGWTLEVG